MENFELYIIWLVVLNSFAILLILHAIFKMQKSMTKYSYLAFLVFSIIYINLIYIIRFFVTDLEIAHTISKFIFFSFSLNFILFGVFIFLIFGKSVELKNLRFWIFCSLNFVFGIAAFIPGAIISGVVQNEKSINPVYGVLYPFYIVGNFILATYIFTIAYIAYRKEQNEVLKYQLTILFFTGIVVFFFVGVMNGMAPAIEENSISSFIDPLGFLLFYMGMVNIISNENNLFIKKEFNKFIKLPPFKKSENVFALKQLLVELNNIFIKNPEMVKAHLNFIGQNSEDLNIFLEKKDPKLKLEGKSKSTIPPGWYQGMLDSFSKLYNENRRLAFFLIRAENLLGEGWISKKIEKLKLATGLPEKDFYIFSNYSSEIQNNLKENNEAFGSEILCFSVSLKKILLQIQSYSLSNQIVTFLGESGTGKSLFAKALHFSRNGGELKEISCQSITREKLINTINEFLAAKKGETRTGLLIKHLDYLEQEKFILLEPIIKDLAGKKFIYFTCSNEFINSMHNIPTNIFTRIKGLTVSIPPIRERAEDIFFQVIYFLKKYSDKFDKKFEAISVEMMHALRKQTWTGNSEELIQTIQSLILNGQSPVLSITPKFSEITENPTVADLSDLTPLELSERETILRYLQSNKYNKNRTRIDLGITINTLNTKIEKYKIHFPDSKI